VSSQFCTLAAQEAGDGLAGSAPARTSAWIVLEHGGPWAPKPLASELPGGARAHLASALDRIPGSRLQLIRKAGRRVEGIVLYVASSAPRSSWLLRFDLGSWAELERVDFEALLEQGQAAGATRETEPLYLVCTHGKRDPCCAKWGVPLYESVASLEPDRSWHTSHVGGHRFAANLVVLPYGLSYGRLGPDDAAPLVDAHRRGELYDPSRLRGRTCFDGAEQAAEVFVRQVTGERSVQAPEIVSGLSEDDETRPERSRLQLRFGDGPAHELIVRREPVAARPGSCGDAPEPGARFVLEDHRGP
jgi:hypothetical protein